jgi:hypothetical protein
VRDAAAERGLGGEMLGQVDRIAVVPTERSSK